MRAVKIAEKSSGKKVDFISLSSELPEVFNYDTCITRENVEGSYCLAVGLPVLAFWGFRPIVWDSVEAEPLPVIKHKRACYLF